MCLRFAESPFESFNFFFVLLVACTRLYKPLCRSVRRSVGRSVGRCSQSTRLMAIGLVFFSNRGRDFKKDFNKLFFFVNVQVKLSFFTFHSIKNNLFSNPHTNMFNIIFSTKCSSIFFGLCYYLIFIALPCLL